MVLFVLKALQRKFQKKNSLKMAITLWIISLIDEKNLKFMDVTTFYIN